MNWNEATKKATHRGQINYHKAFDLYKSNLARPLTTLESNIGWMLAQVGSINSVPVYQCPQDGLFLGTRGNICPFCGKAIPHPNGTTSSEILQPLKL